MGIRKLAHFSPARTILFSIFLTIVAGTLFLGLPAARTEFVSWIDLFFTATSATCVAGLFTINLSSFTILGKCIILGLIQIGGLGLITMTLFFVSMFAEMGLAAHLMAGQLLEINSWKNIKKILIFIILITLYAELLGAFAIFTSIKSVYSGGHGWFMALFQSISAFCNAGISLLGQRPEQIPNNNVVMITTAILMFIGGLGFITWHEITRWFGTIFQKKRYRLSLHSRIVLSLYIVTLIIFAILFWILERENTLATMSMGKGIINAIFSAVSFKSAGFSTVFVANFQLATIFLIMVNSFIGSAPGSTGSGIKLTTFAIFISTVKAAMFGRNSVEIQGRRIVSDQVYRAIAIVAASAGWLIISTFCLLITETNVTFLDVVFETVTAFTSIGLTTGITPSLSVVGKIIIIMSMLIGRIGSFTLILALRLRRKKEVADFAYPEERVMLG